MSVNVELMYAIASCNYAQAPYIHRVWCFWSNANLQLIIETALC